jgi:DNA-directed RNA polymerase specialized sigma24 family protein
MTTNVTSMEEWKRARALDRARPQTKVRAMDAASRLGAQDWGKTLAALSAFAYRRTGKRSWAHAEDLAQAAVTALYAKPDAWDPQNEPLLKHLCKRVIGLASNEWSRKRSSFEVAMTDKRLGELEVSDDSEPVEDVLDRRRMALEFRVRLEQRLGGDETALAVIHAMTDGCAKPEEIALETRLKKAVVIEARRRIFYAANAVSTELGLEIDAADDDAMGDEEEEGVR